MNESATRILIAFTIGLSLITSAWILAQNGRWVQFEYGDTETFLDTRTGVACAAVPDTTVSGSPVKCRDFTEPDE